MRTPRIKEEGAGYYHIVSRVVDRRWIIPSSRSALRRTRDAEEKERFRTILRAMEAFSGCEIFTFAILDNHFHALLYVPERQAVSDEDLIDRLARLYERQEVKSIDGYLKELRRGGHHAAAEEFKARYTYRMYDLSEFVKTLKQRYSQSYNRRHGRKGTLWEERFKSVLIGDSESALSAIAAYIDLNAVRAGIVKDPKDYRFCGYAEAMGGSAQARRGLRKVMCSLSPDRGWTDAAREYRKLLYVAGEVRSVTETGRPKKPGFHPEQVEEVLKADGALPLNRLLRCRIRYFTDGAVLGSRAFVEDVFCRHRRLFGPKRTTGARGMAGGHQWGGLCTLRQLRVHVVTPTAVTG